MTPPPTTDIVTHTVSSTDGVELALHELGGRGPDLVMCHATGFHGRAYLHMVPTLAEHFRVWGIDLRGHGASTPPASGDFGWQGMARDVLACVDAIGVQSVTAFGHSMGGASILMAESMRPGTVAAAYTYEPILFPADYLQRRGENALAIAARKRREVFESRAAALHRYASRPPLDVFSAGSLWAYVEYGFDDLDDGTVRLSCRGEHEAAVFERSEITLESLAGLSLPLTVAAGAGDPEPGPADYAPHVARAIEGATFIEYEHYGHFGPFRAPDLIALDVLAALRPHVG